MCIWLIIPALFGFTWGLVGIYRLIEPYFVALERAKDFFPKKNEWWGVTWDFSLARIANEIRENARIVVTECNKLYAKCDTSSSRLNDIEERVRDLNFTVEALKLSLESSRQERKSRGKPQRR